MRALTGNHSWSQAFYLHYC